MSNAAPKTDPTRAQPGFPRGAAPGRDKGQSPFGPGPAGYGGGAGMGLGGGAGQGWNQGPGGEFLKITSLKFIIPYIIAMAVHVNQYILIL